MLAGIITSEVVYLNSSVCFSSQPGDCSNLLRCSWPHK